MQKHKVYERKEVNPLLQFVGGRMHRIFTLWNSAVFRVQVEFPDVLFPSLIVKCQIEVMQ